MYKILGLDVKNVGNFESVSVDFAAPLTYVRGVNKDSGLSARTTGNGVGKSLLFSCIANLRFGSAPVSVKKNNRREILSAKNSLIGIPVVDNRGDEYEIIQKSAGYVIYKNGEDLQVRGIDRQQKFIRALMPLSEIDFYTREYVSTMRPYPMRVAKDDVRLQHMVDLHRLDQYSAIKDYFSLKASAMRDSTIRIGDVEQLVSDLTKKMEEASNSAIDKSVYAKSKEAFDSLEREASKLSTEKGELLPRVGHIKSLIDVSKRVREARKSLEHSYSADELRAFRKAADKWEAYAHDRKRYDSEVAKIESALSELPKADYSKARLNKLREDHKYAEASLESTVEKIESLEKQRSRYEDAVRYVEESRRATKNITIEVDPKYDYNEDLGVQKSTLKLEALLEHEHSSDGKCPTCRSNVNYDEIKKLVERAKKKIPELREKIQAQKVWVAYHEAKEALEKLEFDEGRYDKLCARKKSLKKEVDSLELQIDMCEKHDLLTKRLSAVEKPSKPSVERPKLTVEEINNALDSLHKVEKLESEQKACLKHAGLSKGDDFEQELADCEKSIKSLESKLSSLSSKKEKHAAVISKYRASRDVVSVYSKELEDAKKKLDTLKNSTKDKKLVDILVKCYGPKGLRSKAAASVCRLLEDNLNQYRDLLFYEPFIFYVESTDAGISIKVDRNNGSPTAVTDVRMLSGAESNAFDLLFCLSDLMITPDLHRTNMLILDEPTCHMDEMNRVLFNERYIPAVQDLVPNLFVITPFEDDYRAGASEWRVVKEAGVTTVQAT